MMPKDLKNKLIHFWKAWGVPILIAVVVATSFKSAIADWNDVPTGSMIPTILEGDRIFVNKLAYDLKIPYTTIHLAKWSDPVRGDIVVFYSPETGKRLVKRVIGLPGESVAMYNNQLFINGKPLVYQDFSKNDMDQTEIEKWSKYHFYIEDLPGHAHPIMLFNGRTSFDTFGPVKIPEGSYFMMGDNRDHSADSRFFGFVNRSRIVGQATVVVISRDESFLHPRWNRFFKDLS